MQDRAIVTIEGEYRNRTLQWPFQRQITWKWYNIQLYLQWPSCS